MGNNVVFSYNIWIRFSDNIYQQKSLKTNNASIFQEFLINISKRVHN